LDREKISKLEGIGFSWSLHQASFDKGFQETIKYKEQNNGNPNAKSGYVTPEGFSLYQWQSALKRKYKKCKLEADRIRELERIGFLWESSLTAPFKRGIEETLRYKEQNNGDPNAPKDYKTADGYKLGEWQSRQIDDFKKGKLESGKASRLEAIGLLYQSDTENKIK